jgi:hypothetical protein
VLRSDRQQRFGRLLKALKAADPIGSSDGGTSKTKTTGKRAAPGKQDGTTLKTKANIKHEEEEEEEEEENEDELDEEETPSKKHKSGKQKGTPKWKSIFEHDNDDVVRVEDDGDGEDDAAGAVTKTEDELEGEVVN